MDRNMWQTRLSGRQGPNAAAGLVQVANSPEKQGNSVPDIVGQLRVDQAWGLFQLVESWSAPSMPATTTPRMETTGHPTDAYGFAVRDRCRSKIFQGSGGSINLDAATRTAQPVTCSAA